MRYPELEHRPAAVDGRRLHPMSQMPLPVRVAAGLAAVAMERARKLPQDVTEWPMTAVSTALQLSMRVQQRITELAIKGDEALAGLRQPEEEPPWAVFDEDLPDRPDLPGRTGDDIGDSFADDDRRLADYGRDESDDAWLAATEADAAIGPIDADDPFAPPAGPVGHTGGTPGTAGTTWTAQSAGAPHQTTDTVAPSGGHAGGGGPAALPGYPGLSLASVRARLRTLTVEQLEELLAYEREHGDRAEFVRMLANRIATVRSR